MLKGKKILVGISGGIAAFKIPSLIRMLVQAGAEVRVVCTNHALEFVTPLTLETVSGYKVYSNLFDSGTEKHTCHVSYADWGDLLIIAPATSNILAKMANGIADDALSTLYLAFYRKVMVATAMNVHMYEHPATVNNISLLAQRGVEIIDAEYGELACGYVAKGRMAEAESIYTIIEDYFSIISDPSTLYTNTDDLRGKNVLVTAGPTQENIDPVRFISNRSSGRMGFCVADELVRRGASVYLVSGPSALEPTLKMTQWEKINTAEEMFEICSRWWPDMDSGVLSAAVADYKIKDPCNVKIKKQDKEQVLMLIPNPDILNYLGSNKSKTQKLVGFALETDNGMEHAIEKMRKKNTDLMVLNSLEDEGAGFDTTTNKVSIIDKMGKVDNYPLESKENVAKRIVDSLSKIMLFFAAFMFFVLGLAKNSSLEAQELNCTLQVVSTKIQNGDKKVFETMQKVLNQFVNGRKWTNLQVGSGERIPCSMTIDIQDRDFNNGSTKAYITVQARRPVYNSSFNTNIMNVLDKDFSFVYNENDPVEFSDNNIGNNFTACIAFYCYLIIGEYLDSFAARAGEYCFSKAENIVNLAQSIPETGWKAGEKNNRNRYWTIESYMNGNYGLIHQIIYQYHRKGMDMMYENPVIARENVYKALEQVKELNVLKNNIPCKVIFMEAKVDELISIFSAATPEEKQKVVELLSVIDASNIQKYQKISSGR